MSKRIKYMLYDYENGAISIENIFASYLCNLPVISLKPFCSGHVLSGVIM